jgi:hypothetical protein
MKIAILGTGMVGRAHADKLADVGHEVVIGTGDAQKTLASTKPDAMGNPPFAVWIRITLAFRSPPLPTLRPGAKSSSTPSMAPPHLHGQVKLGLEATRL